MTKENDKSNEPNKELLSYKEAKKFVRELQIQSRKELDAYCSSGKKPDNVPSNPNQVYKNKGWVNWGDYFEAKGHIPGK